jgi:hypothetical protein
MNRRSLIASFALAAFTALGIVALSSAGEFVPFKGSLEGSYTVTVNPGPPPIGTFEGTGEGQATHLGRFTYEFPHTVNFGAAPPRGDGVYIFTAANGDIVEADFIGYSTPLALGFVLVEEKAVITGGTGRFAEASGNFTVFRLVDQVNGETIGCFEGTISRPRGR